MPADALDLLATRRSVPPVLLREPGPDPAQLQRLLALASRVPDHGMLSPWRFIVIEGEARARASAVVESVFVARNPDADEKVRRKEATRLSMAPTIVAVLSTAAEHVKIPVWEQALTAGAVCENLVVAASAMGFGASWLTGWLAYDAEVLEGLGVRPGERVAGFIHIGTPAEAIAERPRPDVAALTTHFV